MSKGQLKCTVYSQNEEINSTSVKRKSFGAHAALPAKAIRGLNELPCLARSLPPLIDPINLDGGFGQQM